MGIAVESRRGRAALMVAHCAGMVDLVALSVWVGTLISHYGFDAQQAGGLPTVFLLGVVLASVVSAPWVQRLPGRLVSSVGFAIAATAFWLASAVTTWMELAVLHAVAGVASGAALSVTHGTIARSVNPHRLFALVGMALGVFAVVFLAGTPQLIAAKGGPALFHAFAGVMAVGAAASLLAFPTSNAVTSIGGTRAASPASAGSPAAASASTAATAVQAIPKVVWFGIAGISSMTLVQALIFSFLEGVGLHRGFTQQAINTVLIALGLVNLLPAALAALLQQRCSARRVVLVGPLLQFALAATIMLSPLYGPYAVAASLLAAVMVFTHTFAFGLLARLDTSGRALAATPAMLMTGSAIGPFLGGTLVTVFGYEALALAALCLATVAVFSFSRLPATR